jgi:alanyl-tRNA synthetase
VSVGPAVNDLVSNPTLEDWQSYSVEFCGGTHISNTREAKAFVILEETAVAKGIRRISAVTGDDAILAVETAVVLEKEAQSLVDRLKELRDGIDIDTTLLAAIDEVSCLKLFFIDI